MNTSTQHPLQLEQFYRGKWWENGLEKSDLIITACSPGMSSREAERLFAGANLGSFNRTDLARLQHGYGLLQVDAETYLLLHVRPGPRRARGYVYPDYRCIVVPEPIMSALAGNLQPLHALFDDAPHLPELTANDTTLPGVTLAVESASLDREIELVQLLFQEFAHKLELLEQLLSALITKRPVAVLDAPPDPAWRWAICQALLLVLPPQLRQRWTFATEVFDGSGCPARLKFFYKDPYVRPAVEDFQYRWQTGEFRPRLQSIHPYAQFVIQHWDQGAAWLIETLHDQEATAIVGLLQAFPLQDILTILVDRLTVLPTIKQYQAQQADWETIQRLLTHQIRLLASSALAPEATNWLLDDSQSILRNAAQQGLGARAYLFLDNQLRNPELDWQKWHSILEKIALENLRQAQGEADILAVVKQVQQTQSELAPEFWDEFINTLRPACDQSTGITWALLDLWLAHETTTDYKDFLLDANATAQFPPALAALRRHLLHLPLEAEDRTISLVDISGKSPPTAAYFFLDMAEEANTRTAFTLFDKYATRHFAELAQQPEYKHRVLRLVDQLLAAKEQLDEEVLTEFPRLLVKLTRVDQAVEILAHLAQSPRFSQQVLHLINELYRTAPLSNSLEFWAKLQQVPALSDTISQANVSLLEHSDWGAIRLTDEMVEQLKQLSRAYVQSVLQSSSSWPEKAAELNHLPFTAAVQHVKPLLPVIRGTINWYAREKLVPEQIHEMSAAFRDYCPGLYKETQLRVLASLVDAFGSHQFEELERYIATTVRVLENLQYIEDEWDNYEAELRRQTRKLPSERQQDFYRNCNILLGTLQVPLETSTEPVNALWRLLGALSQFLKPTAANKDTQERNPAKKKWFFGLSR